MSLLAFATTGGQDSRRTISKAQSSNQIGKWVRHARNGNPSESESRTNLRMMACKQCWKAKEMITVFIATY